MSDGLTLSIRTRWQHPDGCKRLLLHAVLFNTQCGTGLFDAEDESTALHCRHQCCGTHTNMHHQAAWLACWASAASMMPSCSSRAALQPASDASALGQEQHINDKACSVSLSAPACRMQQSPHHSSGALVV